MKAVFRNRSFVGSFKSGMLKISMLGFSLMMLSISFGLPVFISGLLLVVGIVVGIGVWAGDAVYTLDETGITQKISAFKWFNIASKNITRHFGWHDILGYQMGADLNRSLQNYNYLKIKLNQSPHMLHLSDSQSDTQDFGRFCQLFSIYTEGKAGKENRQNNASAKLPIEMDSENDLFILEQVQRKTKHIQQKPDFYNTTRAKVVFIVMTIIFVGIIAWIENKGALKLNNLFRISFVILPGMVYFYYRIWRKPKN